MNVRFLFGRRIAWRDGHLRRQLIDDVGRLRCIGFWWMFDHVSRDATRLPLKRAFI